MGVFCPLENGFAPLKMVLLPLNYAYNGFFNIII